MLCWVSLHSTQPTFCRCYCELRNPTTADFGTEPQKFLFGLDWTLAASGGARVKLHFKSWSWFHPGTLCLCRLGWAYSRLCWVSLHSTQPTFCRCYCEMRNPTMAKFGTEPQKFLFRLNWPFFWPAANLNPYMKLHYAASAASAAKIICQGTRFARTLTYTMMRISDTIGDPDSVLWNHRAVGVHHRRASSSDTLSQKPRRSGCAVGVTWRFWNYKVSFPIRLDACGRRLRSYETSWNDEWRMTNCGCRFALLFLIYR